MSRVNDFLQNILNRFAAKDLVFLHLSSDRTILAKDNKIIYSQPSCLVYSPSDQQVLAVGEAALKWQAALDNGSKMSFIRPVKDGMAVDANITYAYLNNIFQDYLNKNRFFRGSLFYLYHGFISPLQQEQWKKILTRFAFARLQAVNLASAAANSYHSLTSAEQSKVSMWVIYLDQYCSELSLIRGAECIHSCKLNFCIEDLIIALAEYFRSQDLYVARQELIRLLKQLENVDEASEDRLIQIKAKKQQDKKLEVRNLAMNKVIKIIKKALAAWQEQLKLEQQSYIYNHHLDITSFNNSLLIGQAFADYKFLFDYLQSSNLFKLKKHPKPGYAALQGLILSCDSK